MKTDLLIIGGGINGVGIARDAAGRGLGVVLCEKDDLAQHTSSASTKLIHGGLRYLETYEFGLVSHSLREREVLLRVAPHIIWPLRFVLPHHRALRPRWLIRLRLFHYDLRPGPRPPACRAVTSRTRILTAFWGAADSNILGWMPPYSRTTPEITAPRSTLSWRPARTWIHWEGISVVACTNASCAT